jgi:hypothetical protein
LCGSRVSYLGKKWCNMILDFYSETRGENEERISVVFRNGSKYCSCHEKQAGTPLK